MQLSQWIVHRTRQKKLHRQVLNDRIDQLLYVHTDVFMHVYNFCSHYLFIIILFTCSSLDWYMYMYLNASNKFLLLHMYIVCIKF